MASTETIRHESDEWHASYGDPVEIQRRLRNMPGKLARLGVTEQPRESRILDMCCGHGEALMVMNTWGFRHVEGFDQRIHEPLKSAKEFTCHEGNAHATGLLSNHYDLILNIHSMHHLGNVEQLSIWIEEMRRILKPNGRFAIVDFYASPHLALAFWLFRHDWFHMNRYLRHFGKQVQDEWDFLGPYVKNWNAIRRLLWNNGFEVERCTYDPWYFYLTLRKAPAAEVTS